MSDAEQKVVNPDNVPHSELRGWLTPLIQKALIAGTKPSDWILGRRMALQEKQINLTKTMRRARMVDTFVAMCLGLTVLCYFVIVFAPTWLAWVAISLMAFRTVDIVFSALRITLFDRLEGTAAIKPTVASHVRIIVLGLINYVELSVAFGGIYAFMPCLLKPPANLPDEWFTPLYFSAITQFTIGYGDIAPIGLARFIAVLQGFSSMLLLILIIGRFVSLLRPERSLDDPT